MLFATPEFAHEVVLVAQMQLQTSLISCDGPSATTWGCVSSTSPASTGANSGAVIAALADSGAVHPATPASSTDKL